MDIRVACLLACLAVGHTAWSQQPVEGTWNGSASVDTGESVPFAVTLKTEAGTLNGSIDVPDLGVFGLALLDVVFDGKTLHFTVPLPDGPVPCNGKLNEDGTISGTFDQAGMVGTFVMRKAAKQP